MEDKRQHRGGGRLWRPGRRRNRNGAGRTTKRRRLIAGEWCAVDEPILEPPFCLLNSSNLHAGCNKRVAKERQIAEKLDLHLVRTVPRSVERTERNGHVWAKYVTRTLGASTGLT